MFLKEKKKKFKEDKIFLYNIHKLENIFIFLFYLILFFTIFILINYYFETLEYFENFFYFLYEFIFAEIYTNKTLLGSFFTTLFGGLFFLPIPFELLLYNFIFHNFFLLIFFSILGLTISFTINYYIGQNLSEFTKKIITIKKFYKMKNLINRYGAILIFFFNVVPIIFPSQPLSAILGVFKYNKTKFYIVIISSQIIKYSILIFFSKKIWNNYKYIVEK